jgi:hypothetical protein
VHAGEVGVRDRPNCRPQGLYHRRHA